MNPAGWTLIVALVQTLFDAILAEAMIAFRVDLRIGEMAQADDTYELLVNEIFQ